VTHIWYVTLSPPAVCSEGAPGFAKRPRPDFPSATHAGVILGAALALPSYLSHEAFHSFTKYRFLCNLTSGSNAYIPSNTSIQQIAGTARPSGHGPEGPVIDDRKNDLPVASCLSATPKTHCESDNEVSLFYTSLRVSGENPFRREMLISKQ
jgi:hypothetical protein